VISDRKMATRKTVVIGQPLAGKATCVAALARVLGGKLQERNLANPEHPFGVEKSFGFRVVTAGVGREFWTISGTPWLSSSWRELLLESQSVILVLDAQADREARNVEAIEHLAGKELSRGRGRVVVTKTDFVGVAEAHRQLDRLLRGLPQAAWPTFVHTQKTSDAVRARDLVPGFV
jgi:predicted GTPase